MTESNPLLRVEIDVLSDRTATHLRLARGLGFTDGLILVSRAISALIWEQVSGRACPAHPLPAETRLPEAVVGAPTLSEATALLSAALSAFGAAHEVHGARLSTDDRPGLALERARALTEEILGQDV